MIEEMNLLLIAVKSLASHIILKLNSYTIVFRNCALIHRLFYRSKKCLMNILYNIGEIFYSGLSKDKRRLTKSVNYLIQPTDLKNTIANLHLWDWLLNSKGIIRTQMSRTSKHLRVIFYYSKGMSWLFRAIQSQINI